MFWFDCCASYGPHARPPHRWARTPADLLEQMDFCGIDRALVYHSAVRFSSPATWNEVTSRDVAAFDRLDASWAILPEATGEFPPAPELLDALRSAGVKALRAFPQEHRYRLDGATFGPLLEVAATHNIPLFVKDTLTNMKEFLAECPETLRVVACSQGPHSLERYSRPLLDRHLNLMMETSYMLVDGLIEDFCERYGAHRLLYGSAFPDNCAGGSLLRLAWADISDDDRAKIAGGNLAKLMREVTL